MCVCANITGKEAKYNKRLEFILIKKRVKKNLTTIMKKKICISNSLSKVRLETCDDDDVVENVCIHQ